MDFKDYYEILGVSPDADEKTIKQTYRKLARHHHPDVNPENKEAEEKFKTINEAYQALSNPEQRKKYDELRAHCSTHSRGSTRISLIVERKQHRFQDGTRNAHLLDDIKAPV